LKPVVIIGGKKAIYDPNQNRITIQFHFPKLGVMEGEIGEVILINGDVPRIVVKASTQVEVDRFEPKLDPPEDQKKENHRRMKKK